ncbi:hypothetical protein TNCV_221511 [Trichonephila clavipes]|nr:hypothetical protein TNCV_221511 [Trichonephila clavipes]
MPSYFHNSSFIRAVRPPVGERCTGSGSNPEEGMDVCKWKVPLRHWGTLKGHRAASPLVRLVEGKERWETPPQGVLLKIGVEPS